MGIETTSSVSSSRVRALFLFPNPVNEVSARLVAAGVILMCVLTIAFDLRWATTVIAYGFVARVLTGPTLEPARPVRRRGWSRRVSGCASARWPAPQALRAGHRRRLLRDRAVLTGLGCWTAAEVFLGLLAGAALLESAFGLCLGCKAFAVLMRAGVVPEEVCERCNDIWATHGAAA